MTKQIPVMEIFGPVYQGEGPLVGVQTWFLRTGGCDYRCTFCDSMHAVDPHLIAQTRRAMTCEEIAYELREKMPQGSWLTISGGNPAMWDLTTLIELLAVKDIKVAVETQGTLWHDWIAKCDSIAISPKGPGMGYGISYLNRVDAFYTALYSRIGEMIKTTAFLKIPILSAVDLQFAEEVTRRYPDLRLYLSVGNQLPPAIDGAVLDNELQKLRTTILDWFADLQDMVANHHPKLAHARIFPQQHVLAYGNARGR